MSENERNMYIENNDDEQVKSKYLALFAGRELETELVDVEDSVGRITSIAVFARVCDPVYNAAAMDGIEVRAADTFGATELSPVRLKEGEDFEYINTGGALTKDYDSVIMIEDVIGAGSDEVKLTAPSYPWQYVRTVGESIVAGEMIIPSHHQIRPLDLGALIGGGISKVEVYRRPVAGIIPTGSELTEDHEDLRPGRLMESNSKVIKAMLQEAGAEAVRYPICEDRTESLQKALTEALRQCDIVIINAGSSAGSKDYTSRVIAGMGKISTHGVAVKPGKPTILAEIGGKPVIGLPGYPVSACLMYDMFVKPLVYMYTGRQTETGDTLKATLSKRLVSSFKNKEIIRVIVGYVNGKYIATPLDRGAAAVMSMVRADGRIEIPRNLEGVEAGEEVEVHLLKSQSAIRETLVSTGSHDMIMDVIRDKIKLSSGHVGSMGGIMALRRGECHLSPIHLLDEDTGEYNISYVKKYFPGRRMALIKGVDRIQGFMVAKGNPKNIQTFADLRRSDVTYANRQRGAGTRILLEYHLKKSGLDTKEIKGYEKEFATHMAVAINVKSGNADTGLGILSAAKAMDLDFIPVGNEEYDFLLPWEYLEDERVKAFIEVITSPEFKREVEGMGGYTLRRTGEIIEIC